ncbi:MULTISPECIES: TetR/AcrR family transcriptional regulator [Bacillus]|uniref:Transcriptional regulator n=2 Tax=Bacillus TaxID=1386 RepID=A0A0M4FH09_9BACI|nr:MULTISPECIES: TetR/AcrR family transcriptional regulator [Bacillus]ALC80241.1 transcriptional regulator [Bacillus gobiensis]MBP1082767.1 AcrR family transcriptional regulator [Bacillus capparidis]MED1098411.1 TetR/AcrR family transcriptional regulator [Bacillus capparidis]
MKKKQEETNETIRKLIDIARNYFTERGYAETALKDIVDEARLTRGALYHHFENKKGLFHVVLESVQIEIAQRIEAEASKSDDLWEQLLLGCRAFVTAAVEPRNKRILLIDGPAVIGQEVWRKMDEQNSMRHLREQLHFLNQQGYLKPVSIDAMTHVVSGALNESALWIAENPEDGESLEQTMTAISLLLNGFKR